MTVIIPLTRGYEAIIDDEDAERVLSLKWTAQEGCKAKKVRVYAKSRTSYGSIQLHRFIMDAKKGELVDHINHDTLDNRRSNLRIATPSQNLANVKSRRGKSGYLGIYTTTGSDRFRAEVCCNYKIHRAAGSFATAEEAALARDKIAIRLFGEFAALNFEEHRQTLISDQELEERLAKDVLRISGCGAATPTPNTSAYREKNTSVPLFVATALGDMK